jgi:MoaA/NifB/PqqE/SkfB family radical SAM enzyme
VSDVDPALRAFDDGSWLRLGKYCPGCGTWISRDDQEGHRAVELPPRLWVYTNYDCNLSCRYCLVSSSPWAERRGIGIERFRRLADEAIALGIDEVFLTGGEPFVLPEIYAMIHYVAPRVRTTVLSNAMLLRGKRLDRLVAVNSPNLRIQVSVDDAEPGLHDLYRGEGSWRKAVDGIRRLREAGLRVRVATTVTPELAPRLEAVRRFVREELGIPDEHHVVRPLLKRGFSVEGLEVDKSSLVPELTVDAAGAYWHPAGTDADLLVTTDTGTLRTALEQIARLTLARSGGTPRGFR